MKLPAYPRTKPSGVEWLGDVPEHWDVKRLKHVLRIRSGDAPPEDKSASDGEFPVYGANGIIGYCGAKNSVTERILVGRVGAIGAINLASPNVWISDNALVLLPDAVRVSLRFLLMVMGQIDLKLDATTNAQPLITATQVKGKTLALPPLAEQRAIAALKPSGLDWLGDIPKHWEVKRLKFVSPHITVGIVVEPSKYYVDDGVPALRSLNVKPHRLVENDLVFISSKANEQHAKSKIYEGDLVAVRSGQPGTTAVVDKRFHGANCIDLIIIRKPHGATSAFLDYFLNSDMATAQFETGTGGAIQQHFNITTAASLQIIVPPLPEQAAIAAYLDEETAKLDALVEKVAEAVERLQEYRTALITAAVTGKIDVRPVAGSGKKGGRYEN